MTKSEHLKVLVLIAWGSASKLRSQQPEIVALRNFFIKQNIKPLHNLYIKSS